MSRTLYISPLPSAYNEENLEEKFGQFAGYQRLKICINQLKKMFALIQFDSKENSKKAYHQIINDKSLFIPSIYVRYAKQQVIDDLYRKSHPSSDSDDQLSISRSRSRSNSSCNSSYSLSSEERSPSQNVSQLSEDKCDSSISKKQSSENKVLNDAKDISKSQNQNNKLVENEKCLNCNRFYKNTSFVKCSSCSIYFCIKCIVLSSEICKCCICVKCFSISHSCVHLCNDNHISSIKYKCFHCNMYLCQSCVDLFHSSFKGNLQNFNEIDKENFYIQMKYLKSIVNDFERSAPNEILNKTLKLKEEINSNIDKSFEKGITNLTAQKEKFLNNYNEQYNHLIKDELTLLDNLHKNQENETEELTRKLNRFIAAKDMNGILGCKNEIAKFKKNNHAFSEKLEAIKTKFHKRFDITFVGISEKLVEKYIKITKAPISNK